MKIKIVGGRKCILGQVDVAPFFFDSLVPLLHLILGDYRYLFPTPIIALGTDTLLLGNPWENPQYCHALIHDPCFEYHTYSPYPNTFAAALDRAREIHYHHFTIARNIPPPYRSTQTSSTYPSHHISLRYILLDYIPRDWSLEALISSLPCRLAFLRHPSLTALHGYLCHLPLSLLIFTSYLITVYTGRHTPHIFDLLLANITAWQHPHLTLPSLRPAFWTIYLMEHAHPYTHLNRQLLPSCNKFHSLAHMILTYIFILTPTCTCF